MRPASAFALPALHPLRPATASGQRRPSGPLTLLARTCCSALLLLCCWLGAGGAQAAAGAADKAPSTVKVQEDDVASALAFALKPKGASIEQMMVALLRHNPEAFIQGNVNLVRAGALLRLPPPDEVFRVSPEQARELVLRHHQHFLGQLEKTVAPANAALLSPSLTGPAKPASSAAAGATATADAQAQQQALQERLRSAKAQLLELQENIRQLERLSQQALQTPQAQPATSEASVPAVASSDAAAQAAAAVPAQEASATAVTGSEPLATASEAVARAQGLLDVLPLSWLWLGVAAIVAVMVGVGSGRRSNSRATSTSATTATSAAAPPDQTLTAQAEAARAFQSRLGSLDLSLDSAPLPAAPAPTNPKGLS